MRYFLVGVAAPETVPSPEVCDWLVRALEDRGGEATADIAYYSGELPAARPLPPRTVFTVRREA